MVVPYSLPSFAFALGVVVVVGLHLRSLSLSLSPLRFLSFLGATTLARTSGRKR
jgi:hypothetical protein